MSTLSLLLAEIGYRRVNFLLSLSAVVAAATLFVGGPALIVGYSRETSRRVRRQEAISAGQLKKLAEGNDRKLTQMREEMNQLLENMDRETRRLMRNLGFNLLILHRDTDMTDFYSEFRAVDMPQEYVYRLANSPDLTKVRHLVATLQAKYTWNNRKVLLVGILPEVVQTHLEEKPPMGYVIQRGTVLLGSELGVGRQPGETITLEGKEFKIEKVLPEQGTKEDIMIAMNLSDAQEVLGKPDKISQIVALGCKCEIDRLAEIRDQLQRVLPEAKVTEYKTRAIARAEERKLVAKNRAELIAKAKDHGEKMLETARRHHAEIIDGIRQSRADVERMLGYLVTAATPLVALMSAIWIGLLAWSNVRERRPEIGVLRAIGKGSGSIAALFLGKAMLLGLAGSAAGCVLGYGTTVLLGVRLTPTFTAALVAGTTVAATLLVAIATYLPMLSAIRQDPATALRDL